MDLVLDLCDRSILTPYVYPASFQPTDWRRQMLSLYVIVTIGAYALYFICATFSYFFIFDQSMMLHPKFLKNQVRMEIRWTVVNVPCTALPSATVFLLEVRGYSKMYDGVENGVNGWLFIFFSTLTFLMFTDCLIYWTHRALHSKLLYKYLHKQHHKLLVPTPFASHAFNPIDTFVQSLPYHIYPFLFPLNKLLYIALFVFVNIWTVSIHDGDYRVPDLLQPFINGAAHHTDHHLFFNYNYGQFFTLWDRIGGSYKNPSALEGEGPGDTVRRLLAVKDN